jgi:hypothetical protein
MPEGIFSRIGGVVSNEFAGVPQEEGSTDFDYYEAGEYGYRDEGDYDYYEVGTPMYEPAYNSPQNVAYELPFGITQQAIVGFLTFTIAAAVSGLVTLWIALKFAKRVASNGGKA